MDKSSIKIQVDLIQRCTTHILVQCEISGVFAEQIMIGYLKKSSEIYKKTEQNKDVYDLIIAENNFYLFNEKNTQCGQQEF